MIIKKIYRNQRLVQKVMIGMLMLMIIGIGETKQIIVSYQTLIGILVGNEKEIDTLGINDS